MKYYLLIPFLPLAAFLINILLGKEVLRDKAHWPSILAVVGAWLVTIFNVLPQVMAGKIINEDLYTWIASGTFNVSVGFLIDPLTAVMLVVVTTCASLIHIYAVGYMHGDSGYYRFFAYMSLFTFCMLMLVMGNNFLQLYFGWEGVGLCSYFLIGYYFNKKSAADAGKKAFIVNRFGDFGFGYSEEIVTLFQLERLLDANGPTKGQLVVSGTVPKNIAFIMCVGSLGTTENAHRYCSRTCCASSLKNMIRIRALYPDATIYAIYKDIRTYGRHDETLYEQATEQRVKFINFEKTPNVNVDPNGITIEVRDATLQASLVIPVDLVVLAVGMSPSSSLRSLRSVVKVGCSPEGFLREAHPKLRPVEAPADGIFFAGSVSGPKNVIESSMAGSATAAKASALFAKGEFHVEPITAQVTEELCSGCAVCIAMCPYGAISRKSVGDKKRAEVDRALCKACGACVAACPSGAMQQAGFKDTQLLAQIAAISERREM